MDFSDRLLHWWGQHGRHDLPWQILRTPYRVWVSEIMLQQTRAETVCGYFQRFVERFPDIQALAGAELDEVLALWSGLGYYARARNLHAAAIIVVDQHGGKMPDRIEALEALPGIGRSTAAAIVAQAFDRRATILDGNVKRVMARHAGIDGWPGRGPVQRLLWIQADLRTPDERAADYTQAVMDLGAMLCRPRKPACEQCPVAGDCVARADRRQHELPSPRPRRHLPERSETFVIARNRQAEVLLVRRPPSGIWGGLWCLPERSLVDKRSLMDKRGPMDGSKHLDGPANEVLPAPPSIRHSFTHFRLELQFEQLRLEQLPDVVADDQDWRWMTLDQAARSGLPQPIRTVLEGLEASRA